MKVFIINLFIFSFVYSITPDECINPIIPGIITRYCDSISIKYGYDINTKKCIPFMYTGCNMGTKNIFSDEKECENICIKIDKNIL